MNTRQHVAFTTVAATVLSVGLLASVALAGDVTGTISLSGDAPQRRAVKMAADPQCEAANPDGRLGEVFVVSDGKLQNVFVYLYRAGDE